MGWHVEQTDGAAELLARHALADPSALLGQPSARLIEKDQATFALVHGNGAGLVRRLRGLPTQGRGLFDQLLALTEARVPCPRPLLYARQQLAGFMPGRWVVLAEAPPASRSLPRFARESLGPGGAGRRERRRLLDDLAYLLRGVAAHGWANPRCPAHSILVSGWPGAYRPLFAGSPLAHPTDGPAPLDPGLLRELAGLLAACCTRAELLRFLRACDGQAAPRLMRSLLR